MTFEPQNVAEHKLEAIASKDLKAFRDWLTEESRLYNHGDRNLDDLADRLTAMLEQREDHSDGYRII